MPGIQVPNTEQRFQLIGPDRSSASSRDVLTRLRCPISGKLLQDPLLAADGYSYERSALNAWFNKHGNVSPRTGKPMDLHAPTPNRLLKSLVEEWRMSQMGGRHGEHVWDWQGALNCPIELEPMQQPVQLSDGSTYNKTAAQAVVQRHDSPITFTAWDGSLGAPA